MTKYVRRPRPPVAYGRESDWIWLDTDSGHQGSVTVYEPDDKQTFTGLYDADGTPLYRDDYRPIGFLHT